MSAIDPSVQAVSAETAVREKWTWSLWHAMPLFAVIGSVWFWSGGLRDADQFWHVLIGQDILQNQRFTGDPAWVFGPSNEHWVTTQWAFEVLMAAGHYVFEWRAGLYSLLVVGVALLLWWGWLLLRPGPGLPARAVVYSALAVDAMASIQERPSLASFAFLTVVAIGLKKWLVEGWWPRWWVPPAMVLVWAQFHGAWVMVPAVMSLAALADWATSRSLPGARRELVTRFVWAIGSAFVAVLTPAGLYGLFSSVLVSASASPFISEWQPTTLTTNAGIGLFGMVGVAVVAWARTRDRVPLQEIIVVLGIMAFALLAFRNVPVGLILIAPIVARRAALTWPYPQKPADMVDKATVAVMAVIAVGAVGVSFARVAAMDPMEAETSYATIAALNEASGARRVVNDYNIAGRIEALTGDSVQVAIDGRTDRYGPVVIQNYLDMLNAKPGWRETFEELAPTDVVLEPDRALEDALESEGWTVVVDDGVWVYLTAPQEDSAVP